jgi:hypothetical protein
MTGRKKALGEQPPSSSLKEQNEIQAVHSLDAKKDRKVRVGAGTKTPPVKKQSTRRKWKKPKDMPPRPLSAYNLFFAHSVARAIATKWKSLKPASRSRYEKLAEKEEGRRYKVKLSEWKKKIQEERQLKDQHFQAECAATIGSRSMWSSSDSSSNIHHHIAVPKNSMTRAGMNPPPPKSLQFVNMESAKNSEAQSSLAMPQTIESLEDIYEASIGQTTLDLDFATPLINFFGQEEDSQVMMTVKSRFSNCLPMDTAPSPSHNQDFAVFPPRRNVRSPHYFANVASRSGINILASKLDEESFKFLLSLNTSNADRGTSRVLRRKVP